MTKWDVLFLVLIVVLGFCVRNLFEQARLLWTMVTVLHEQISELTRQLGEEKPVDSAKRL